MNCRPKTTTHTTITIDNNQLAQLQAIKAETSVPVAVSVRQALKMWLASRETK